VTGKSGSSGKRHGTAVDVNEVWLQNCRFESKMRIRIKVVWIRNSGGNCGSRKLGNYFHLLVNA
jgi:hypothetical protein